MGALAHSSCPLVLGTGQGQALGREAESRNRVPWLLRHHVSSIFSSLSFYLTTLHFTSGNSLWFSFQSIGFESLGLILP